MSWWVSLARLVVTIQRMDAIDDFEVKLSKRLHSTSDLLGDLLGRPDRAQLLSLLLIFAKTFLPMVGILHIITQMASKLLHNASHRSAKLLHSASHRRRRAIKPTSPSTALTSHTPR